MAIDDLMRELNQEIRSCGKCKLAETRVNALCGEGNLNAKLMLIAQAPGKNEDREGRMFIGPSGKVLDEILAAVQVDRKEIYMTNLIKCMLPKNRRPKRQEIEICRQYLEREMEIIKPKALAPLGYFATRYLFAKYEISFGSRQIFPELCGKLLVVSGQGILPLPHPAVVLYNGSIKQEVINNYSMLRIVLG